VIALIALLSSDDHIAGALVELEPSVLHRRFLALVVAELAQLADEAP